MVTNLKTVHRYVASLAFHIFVLILVPAACSGQRLSFTNGIYLTHESLLQGIPDRTDTLKVVRRTDKEVHWWGGNAYRLESDKEDFNWRQVHNKVLCYVYNDSIFLNGKKMDLESAFCLALTKGTYLAFHNTESKSTGGIAAAGVLGGVIGAAIATAATQKDGRSNMEALYVLSLRTGNAKRLGPIYMTARLEENSPELLSEFKSELHPESDKTLIDYINRLNALLDR